MWNGHPWHGCTSIANPAVLADTIMAPINTPFNLSSSPPSGGTRTRDGTPSTLATFMSPDTGQDGLDNAVDIEKLELGTPR